MISKLYFAQATQVPGGGASNAQDFQPPTRNPQSAPGNLQPTGLQQQTSPQEVLNQTNTRIIVPKNPADPPEPAAIPQGGGINWALVLISTAVIVFVVERFFRRRDAMRSVEIYQEPEVPESSQLVQPEEPPAQIQPASDESNISSTTSKETALNKPVRNKKKKSKSKRKRR